MTWNPTHVQLTVLRARNLPTKGKGGARLNDVFVTIQLAKEKFQTSTIKNAVNPEWFEQCDLPIPSMQSEIQIHVMHRGMLTDDFIGYCSIPLSEYNLYDRPKSQWVHLQGKPHKPPDNKIRGDIEVRVSFHVKSTTEDALSPGLKKSKSPSLKALTSIGQKVGDKLKFARSRSFRESRSPEAPKQGNGVMPRPVHNDSASLHQSTHNNENSQQVSPLGNGGNHSFSAVDISCPIDESSQGMDRISRSLSVQGQMAMADDVQYNMRMAGNRQSLPPSYWATQTLPYHKGKRYGMSVHRSAENVNTLSPGQPGYLESMFKKEREVYHSMQQQERNRHSSESSEDEREAHRQVKPRKYAKEYSERQNCDSESDSDSVKSDEEIALPEVRRKEGATEKIEEDAENANEKIKEEPENATEEIKEEAENTHENSVKVMNNLSPIMSESPSHSHQENDMNYKSVTETSFPENGEPPVPQKSKSYVKDNNAGTSVPSSEMINGEKQLTAPPRNRKKIAPSQNFTFGQSPDKPEVENATRRRPKKERDRLRKLYKQGGRRYTVQGLDFPRRQNSFEEALVDLRPQFPQEMVIPQDLITVYRNMTKEELIQLVIQHKAQLIRKDQYVKDMEDYIDNLLVRVMESSPRLLQNSNPPKPRQWHL